MKAIINDTKYETKVIGYWGNPIMAGDILISMDADGLAWNCEVIKIYEDIAHLKKLRVNDIFYNYVQKMYNQYNIK